MLRRVLREVKARGLEPVAQGLPRPVMRRLVKEATRDLAVGVCLHRVQPSPRPYMLSPGLAHTEEELDHFLDLFALVPDRLYMTFDDGYEDARRYIASRAPRHPEVQFRFMVCPDKTQNRFGFAWDSWVLEGREADEAVFQQQWKAEARPATEHGPSRAGVGDRADYRLASVEDCKALSHLANVELGNHTDHHIPTAWLSDDELDDELAASQARFERLFGPPAHLAFPFGTDTYVLPRDVARAKALHEGTVWTVDTIPIDPGGDRVWARFPWASDDYSPPAMALYMATKCVEYKARQVAAPWLDRLDGADGVT